jgi:hypothetical protein
MWLQDMPPMQAAHAPDSDAWANSIAMCAVMKDEQLEDVQEWLSYYRCGKRLLPSLLFC